MSKGSSEGVSTGIFITSALPTGKGAFVDNCGLYVGLHIPGGMRLSMGSGFVNVVSATEFSANGILSFDKFGHSVSGTFSLTLSSPDQGVTYSLTYALDLTYNVGNGSQPLRGNNTVPVTPAQSGTGTDTAISWASAGPTVTQSFQNDTLIQRAMALFGISATSVQLCLYNASVSDAADKADFAAMVASLGKK